MYYLQYITMLHSYHFIYPHLETATEYDNTHAKEHPFKSLPAQNPTYDRTTHTLHNLPDRRACACASWLPLV